MNAECSTGGTEDIMKGKKEELSEYVEGIFKSYATPGLHVCDLATGGGKSYTIAKLACEYYTKHFDRIIILCVQTKLVDGMSNELYRFTDKKGSVRKSDVMVVRRNDEVTKEAIENGSLENLLVSINHEGKREGIKGMSTWYNDTRTTYSCLKNLFGIKNSGYTNDIISTDIAKAESSLRNNIKSFFKSYKAHLERTLRKRAVSIDYVLKKFPELETVYPHVRCREKKILLMTVDKAMYGIDTILKETFTIKDFSDKKSLIIFDESDQAAIAMRKVIVDQSIGYAAGQKWEKKYSNGYHCYLQYKYLTENNEVISTKYHGTHLVESLQRARKIITRNWQQRFGDIIPYKNILPGNDEEIDIYRRGVFFCGPIFMLNVNGCTKNKLHSYICTTPGESNLFLVHSQSEDSLKGKYQKVIPLYTFLCLIKGNMSAIKKQLRNVIKETYETRRKNFYKTVTDKDKDRYFNFPTLEKEIHTLMSRFETPSERMIEEQLNDFITNRKNLKFLKGGKTLKMPDTSVYSQGIQLYQEELDDMDNLHRVSLFCREIGTTPEKIIYDLVSTGKTSVVLNSATSSNRSVIGNFDIEYLKETLGDKIHLPSYEEDQIFDELSRNTYPHGHQVSVIRLEKYEYEQTSKEKVFLPGKYRSMFSEEAINDGLVDEWFKLTKAEIFSNTREGLDPTFQLNRLFQFIEAYHWFIHTSEVHSMLYFQNQSAKTERASQQFRIISCLVDGSYKTQPYEEFDMELPKNWKNRHLFMFDDLRHLEQDLLKRFGTDRNTKVMMIAAYGSLKAGVNLQYTIPEGLDCLKGDNWQEENLKKDWDSIYLQLPTNYLTIENDNFGIEYEKSLYRALLSLMMLYERGCINKNAIVRYINSALSTGKIIFHEDSAAIDKAAWAQAKIEQAVGRICRTRNKPKTTYILYDSSIDGYLFRSNMQKSLTKEFKTLADHILSKSSHQDIQADAQESMCCNDANMAQEFIVVMLGKALRYTPHHEDIEAEDIYDDTDDEDIPDIIRNYQIMYQSFKQTIIRKPVIDSLDELAEEDKIFTKIWKCYGDWKRNDRNEYWYSYIKNGRKATIVPMGAPGSKRVTEPVSPSSVRLDVLMKNGIIRAYFERKGYATSWKPGTLILHPQIIRDIYAGEIGEEAFKAIVLEYTHCGEDDIVHLEGKEKEHADFIVNNPDGSHKVGFDVKNMNPHKIHDDADGDIPTSTKREIKEKRLGCRIITVNMVRLQNASIARDEISGVIDDSGYIIPDAIELIKHLIDD